MMGADHETPTTGRETAWPEGSKSGGPSLRDKAANGAPPPAS